MRQYEERGVPAMASPLAEMERETGIEPVTSSLGSWRSTAELLPLFGSMFTEQLCEKNSPHNNLSGFCAMKVYHPVILGDN